MYSTCLSCHAPLGTNEMIEHFPVGRKLAFDQARGRLWAVCTVCHQWNLAALDERWEAIEEAERLYRDARLRASTDNVGLTRVADGTELVRIGEPLRPEFAAWRYGQRFAKRWRIRGPVAAVGGGAAVLLKKIPIFVSIQFLQYAIVPLLAYGGVRAVSDRIRKRRDVAHIALPDGQQVRLTQAHVEHLKFRSDPQAEDGWMLTVKHSAPGDSPRPFHKHDPVATFTGAEATRLAGQLLPRVNRLGGHRRTVAEAVALLEEAGDAAEVFRRASLWRPDVARKSSWKRWSGTGMWDAMKEPLGAPAFATAPAPFRLAAEMAANEEQERALIHGELASLEAQWREAEEIAAIADALTLPPGLLRQLERLRVR